MCRRNPARCLSRILGSRGGPAGAGRCDRLADRTWCRSLSFFKKTMYSSASVKLDNPCGPGKADVSGPDQCSAQMKWSMSIARSHSSAMSLTPLGRKTRADQSILREWPEEGHLDQPSPLPGPGKDQSV